MNPSILTKKQVKRFYHPVTGDGSALPERGMLVAEARYDDACGNGHNTFAITLTVEDLSKPLNRRFWSGGCQHELIAEHFPELAHLIKWHLCSSDGPMHYAANTVYSAGDRDCHGKRKGEASSWSHAVQFGDNPIKHKLSKSFAAFLAEESPAFDLEVIRLDHGPDKGGYQFAPKYTFGGYADKWHECPFDTEPEALAFLSALQACSPQFLQIPTSWSDGKTRELDAARRAAVWPEATDEELMAEPEALKAALMARLPELLSRFRADIEALGFVW